MSKSLSDIPKVGDEPEKPAAAEPRVVVVAEHERTIPPREPKEPAFRPVEAKKGEPKAEKPEGAAPPAAVEEDDDAPLVPRAALKDERTKRQALEAELAQLRARDVRVAPLLPVYDAPQKPVPMPDMFEDPDGYTARIQQDNENARINDRLGISVEMARIQYTDYDDVEKAFVAEAKTKPWLVDEMMRSPAPALYAYREGKKIMAQTDIGDPLTYKERLTAELRALWEAEANGETATPSTDEPAPVKVKPKLPTSLASERSVAPRAAPGFSGPTPLSDIADIRRGRHK